jgi:transcription-repair coupling factor (superfamily II helicase)
LKKAGKVTMPQNPIASPSTIGQETRAALPRQQVMSSLAVVRGNASGTQTSSSDSSLSKLHKQLEDQAGGGNNAAAAAATTTKPLDGEAATKLRERLREQRQKGMQAIRDQMKGRGQPDSEMNEDVSYAVDPDTLTPGEFVVHKRVGIGRFIGTKYEVFALPSFAHFICRMM